MKRIADWVLGGVLLYLLYMTYQYNEVNDKIVKQHEMLKEAIVELDQRGQVNDSAISQIASGMAFYGRLIQDNTRAIKELVPGHSVKVIIERKEK